MKMGWTIPQIHELTHIDPWFLAQMKQLVDFEEELARCEVVVPKGESLQRAIKLIAKPSSGDTATFSWPR